MRKLLLILMALFLWVGGSWAQNAIIGSGTTTSNGSTADPVERYYNYEHMQIVYLATELTTAGMPSGATINALGFSISESAVSLANYTISMGHTTQTLASPYISTGLAPVKSSYTYTPVVQTAGNFDMISFTSNFTWDGTNNIVIDICTGSNPFTSPYGGLRYTTATSGAMSGYRLDGSSTCGLATTSNYSYRPNIRFDYTSTSPNLNTVPGSLAFGYVPSESYGYNQYVLSGTNLTAGPIVVTAPSGFGVSLSNGGPYTSFVNVSYTPPTLGNTDIFVQFAPTGAPAFYSDNITNLGGDASADIAVTGRSVATGDDCTDALDLAGLTSPYNSETTTANNNFSFCSITSKDRIYYYDVANGATIQIWQSYNDYDSRHTMRYGGSCPGDNEIGCYDEPDYQPISWTNGTGTAQRVWWINAGYGSSAGNFTLEWIYTPPPTCIPPLAQTVTNISMVGADLGWTSTESFFDIYIVPTGDPAPTAGSTPTVDNTGDNPYTWSGGVGSSTYDWYVRADCDAGGGTGQSDWTGPNTFSTLCGAISAFPWTENFTGTQQCWTVLNVNADADAWDMNYTSNYNSAPEVAMMYTDYNDGANDDYLITPQLTLSGNQRIKFWQRVQSSYEPNDFELLLSTTGKVPADFTTTLIPNTSYSNTTYQQLIVDLSAYSGNVYIAWHVKPAGLDGYRLFIDDVTVEEAPSDAVDWCNLQWPDVASIELTQNVTVYSRGYEPGVTEAAGPGTGIICWIGYNTTDTDPSTWTNWVATTYNFGIDPNNNDEFQADLGVAQGLAPGTYYYASRWQLNGGPYTYGGYNAGGGGFWDGTTNVSGVLTVTPCAAAAIPYFENFDGVTAPEMPPCMNVENVNADSYTWVTNASYGLSAPNAAYISYNSSMAMDDWMFTKGLQLTGGTTYEVGFAFAASSSFPEKLSIYWGNDAVSSAMINGPIFDQTFTGGYYLGTATFTPSTTGVYYIGFWGHSDADEFWLAVDDIYVTEAIANVTWNGSIDNDWGKALNWNEGVTPASSTNVFIPAGSDKLSYCYTCCYVQ